MILKILKVVLLPIFVTYMFLNTTDVISEYSLLKNKWLAPGRIISINYDSEVAEEYDSRKATEHKFSMITYTFKDLNNKIFYGADYESENVPTELLTAYNDKKDLCVEFDKTNPSNNRLADFHFGNDNLTEWFKWYSIRLLLLLLVSIYTSYLFVFSKKKGNIIKVKNNFINFAIHLKQIPYEKNYTYIIYGSHNV